MGCGKLGLTFWLSILVTIAPSMNAELALPAERNVREQGPGKRHPSCLSSGTLVAEHGGEGEGGGLQDLFIFGDLSWESPLKSQSIASQVGQRPIFSSCLLGSEIR